jgi:hypothetical protein
MHCTCTIVFVGGNEAKREAADYHVRLDRRQHCGQRFPDKTFWRNTKPEWVFSREQPKRNHLSQQAHTGQSGPHESHGSMSVRFLVWPSWCWFSSVSSRPTFLWTSTFFISHHPNDRQRIRYGAKHESPTMVSKLASLGRPSGYSSEHLFKNHYENDLAVGFETHEELVPALRSSVCRSCVQAINSVFGLKESPSDLG